MAYHRPGIGVSGMGTCNYLRLSVTDRCQLRCLYCMPPQGVALLSHDDLLSFAEIEEVVAASVDWGVRKVRLTGGEPLLRRGVLDLMAMLGRLPGLDELVLTTNGLKFGPMAEQIKQAGVSAVTFSLDSLRPERFEQITRGGRLTEAMAGIDAAIRAGFKTVKINAVVMKGLNEDELLDFVRFAIDRPVTVRFIELMPLVAEPAVPADGFVATSAMRKTIDARHELQPVESSRLSGPAQEFVVDGGAGQIGFISPVSNPFCNSCNRLRLTCHGNLRACLASEEAVPLRQLLRGEHTPQDIIAAFDQAVKMKATCGSGCYAATSMSQIGG